MKNTKIGTAAKKNTIKNIKGLRLGFSPLGNIFNALFISASLTLFNQVNANEQVTTRSSISYGALAETINDVSRATIIKQNNTILVPDQLTGKATGKTRNEIQAAQLLPEMSPQARSLTLSISNGYSPEFSIYNATTLLRNDFDSDGYYQTLSVIFDADMYSYDDNDFGEVYARLYLSEHGGPWIHYYSSDNFIIHSDSDQDAYEVMTTFREGYYPSDYDLLIDLYQVGSNSIVATYSADDSSALYALPLESRDYDDVYIDSDYQQQGGSFSAWSLVILLLVLASRLSKRLLKIFA
ncbi:choice-of-anchor H family protein [Psychromonas antarctica]|uniref:choice-of-anchor H family protein n=1 Tax=Psychromonas antarctica TaxID=67573 RepID=UPI001EE98619|nr:choice-of-anchor H family protein [Psychromonas antarctica]MCG6202629.1 choice-of-anchor H family protein [Psychromonas antarctica]